MVSDEQGRTLIRLARRTLELHFGRESRSGEPEVEAAPHASGVFATIKVDGVLRGCIGYVLPNLDLVSATKRAVLAAATNDPRFPSVTADELSRVHISVSVLAKAERVGEVGEIEIGRDGLVVEREGARGLLLPQVAVERQWDRERFLAETCAKAGLPPDSWNEPETAVYRFAAIQFAEEGA